MERSTGTMSTPPPVGDVGPEMVNPYAPPTSLIGEFEPIDAGDLARSEEVRQTYLRHEASIRSLGTIHYGASFLFFIAAFSVLSVLAVRTPPRDEEILALAIGLGIGLLLGALNLALGGGLQGLRPWARVTETILAALALGDLVISAVALGIAFENEGVGRIVGIAGCLLLALIPGYVISLLRSSRGRMVFSREYSDVIERTPHIRPPTSRGLLIALAVIVLLATLVMVAVIVIGGAS
jgi:hypothetical protein